MTDWITSDLHFGHTNIMKYCPNTRRFRDVAHMNEAMIREWNDNVANDDTVYILGDFAFYIAEEAARIAQRLKGNKILIKGNHDDKLVKSEEFLSCFAAVHTYYDGYKYNKKPVIMFHYPIGQWDRMGHGSIHLHGHLHGSPSGLEKYRARDVGFDATGKVVSLLDKVCADAITGEVKAHH